MSNSLFRNFVNTENEFVKCSIDVIKEFISTLKEDNLSNLYTEGKWNIYLSNGEIVNNVCEDGITSVDDCGYENNISFDSLELCDLYTLVYSLAAYSTHLMVKNDK